MQMATHLFTWLALGCTTTYFLLFFLIRHRPRRKSQLPNLPPGPAPLPIIGSLHKLGDRPHLSLAELSKCHGPLMSLRLGHVTTIVASSPAVAREILQKNDQYLASRFVPDAVHIFDHNKKSVVWSPLNHFWRNLKRISATQLFTNQRLDTNQGLRRAKVQELLDHVRSCCSEGLPVDIGRAAFVTAINLISNTVFSVDLVGVNSESSHEFKETVWAIMVEAGSPNLSDYFPILRWMDLQGRRRRQRANFQKLHAFFDKMIDDRLRHASANATCRDFLDVLLQSLQRSEIDRVIIKSLLTDIFTAGSDTSSNTVEWAMAELLHNPKAMARAQAELSEIIGFGNHIEESDFVRLPYLQSIVKETLRLHPPAPFLIPRKAEDDVDVGGFTIPKHAQVLVNVWAIGRDTSVWEDPDNFNPTRFMGSGLDYKGKNFELIPFGSGSRTCPGLPLADRMVHFMLASLLCSFHWSLPDGMSSRDMDMSDMFGITLAKAVPLRAVPTKH
ncbi:Geraniol 8-hydroxylase [Acorus calamus]|uniref:Geraniol 8-hydroxylase n=1 Tax=Acorus calamus TaxID=4465 RepID=A0AAV9DJU6_ACOCL|nr:Geraniol 8-hydroxylase [Acorus calamus]